MSGHTPGPWRVDLPNRAVEAKAFDGSYRYVCAPVRGGNPKQANANASLIAAAPEILSALKNCVIERSEWLQEARAAIAKAEGLTP